MKKFIRFTVILVLVVVAALLILALVEPTNIPISRSIVIKAPKEVVFDQIVKFKNWPHWNPWDRIDSNMKKTYAGTDGRPGSSFSWDGNDKVGSGNMNDSAVNGTQMIYVMNMLKPWKNTASGYLKAEDTAGMTKVTWEMTAHMAFPFNAMDAFMNMDKLLGGDFENGLSYMKQYIEQNNTPVAADVQIKEVDYPAHIYQGVRSMVNWSNINQFCTATYGILEKTPANKINGPRSGLYFVWDTANKRADMAAVFPVSDTLVPVKGASYLYVGAAKSVMAVEKGGYGQSMKYHNAIMNYMASKGMKHGAVIEEYIVAPQSEPDSNKWVTNIYYLVQ